MDRLHRAIRLIVELDHRQRVTILWTVLLTVVGVAILMKAGGAPHETAEKASRQPRATQGDGWIKSLGTAMRSALKPKAGQGSGSAEDEDLPPEEREAADAASSPEGVESGSGKPARPEPHVQKTAADRVAERAKQALSPEVGLKQLEKHLKELLSKGEASRVYSAMTDLHLQTDPPNVEEARAAVRKALELAETPEEKDLAGYTEVDMHRRLGEIDEAKAQAHAILNSPGPATVPRLKTGLLDASLSAEAGATEEAADSYKQVMKEALTQESTLGGEAREIYRIAGLRLNRLYRAAGRDKEADAIAEEVGKQGQE